MMNKFWTEAFESYTGWLVSDVQYECYYCDVHFYKEEELLCHVEQVHRVYWDKYMTDNPYYMASLSDIQCDLCGNTVRNVKEHLNKVHGIEPELYFMRFVFVSKTYDTPVKETEQFSITYTGNTDPNTKVYIIPYAKLVE